MIVGSFLCGDPEKEPWGVRLTNASNNQPNQSWDRQLPVSNSESLNYEQLTTLIDYDFLCIIPRLHIYTWYHRLVHGSTWCSLYCESSHQSTAPRERLHIQLPGARRTSSKLISWRVSVGDQWVVAVSGSHNPGCSHPFASPSHDQSGMFSYHWDVTSIP